MNHDCRARMPPAPGQGTAAGAAIAREPIDYPEVRRFVLQPHNGNVVAIVEDVERADRHRDILL
jgi:hypothetical protein